MIFFKACLSTLDALAHVLIAKRDTLEVNWEATNLTLSSKELKM